MHELGAAEGLELEMTSDAIEMPHSMAFVVHLNGRTWTSGASSGSFAHDVSQAMQLGVPLLLAHEVPAITPDQQGRHGVKFETFFTCAEGATPEWLLRKGIYSEIAIPMTGGELRGTSLMMVASVLSKKQAECSPEQRDWQSKLHEQARHLLGLGHAHGHADEHDAERHDNLTAFGIESNPIPAAFSAATAMKPKKVLRAQTIELSGLKTLRPSQLDDDGSLAPISPRGTNPRWSAVAKWPMAARVRGSQASGSAVGAQSSADAVRHRIEMRSA